MAESSPKGVENTVGKEEIAHHFRHVKTRACLGKG